MRANPKEIVTLLQHGLTTTDDKKFFAHRLPRSGKPKTFEELSAKYQNWLHLYNKKDHITVLILAHLHKCFEPEEYAICRVSLS